MKLKLIEAFEDKLPPLSQLKCGYLEKCTIAKRRVEDDKDLDAMYKSLKDNTEITLSSDTGTSSKRSTREESIDQIVESLRDKHGENFSGPQYRMWARMKLNGQHSSLDQPPPYPLFSN